MEVLNPYVDFAETNVTDKSITEFEYIEYLPRDANMNNPQIIIETRDEDVYLLPHKSFLEIQGRLQTAAGVNYVVGNAISLVNNGCSLFQSAQYQLSNKMIEDVSEFLPYAATILNLVQFSDDYSRSTASNMMWFKDTGEGKPTMAAVTPITAVSNTADAAMVRTRVTAVIAAWQQITTGDKQVTMFLSLSQIFGFCNDVHTVFRGIKHTLILDRSLPAQYIMKDAGVTADGKFVISHLSLWMPKVTPNLELQVALEAKLVEGHIKNLYFEQIRVYRTTFQPAETSPTWRITTLPGSELPRHIFIALQSSERHPTANPQTSTI